MLMYSMQTISIQHCTHWHLVAKQIQQQILNYSIQKICL